MFKGSYVAIITPMHADGLGVRQAGSGMTSGDSVMSRMASVSKAPSACIGVHLRLNLLTSLCAGRCGTGAGGCGAAKPHAPGQAAA